MTYGHLQADCLYTGISSGPTARYRVWEAFTFYHQFIGRTFVKRFALCYQTIVCCLSVLSCLLRFCIVAKRLDGSR